MVSMGLVHNLSGLIISRVFLGLMEAGFFPGVAFYLSCWYLRVEHSFRLAIFFAMATMAGAFGGLLAFGIGKMEGIGGKAGWSWIFILEGILTVIVSCVSPLMIKDWPRTAKFLTEKEREYVIYRLRNDVEDLESKFEVKYVWEAFKNPKMYMMILIYLGANCGTYAIAFFLPTIISNLGYAAATAQLMTVPPYVCACLATIGCAWLSDRIGARGLLNASVFAVGIMGFIVLISTSTPGARYVGTFFAAIGTFPAIALSITWNANNISDSPTKRAVSVALQSSCGSFGGVIGSYAYRKSDAPAFRQGHAIMIGLLSLSLVCSVLMVFYLGQKKPGDGPGDLSNSGRNRARECKEGLLAS